MKYTFKFPDELVIGYQEREDAMTGKLAFINFKENNKLRVEKEFNYWCSYLLNDKFKNVPRSGFLISKAVERSHQSLMGGKSYMRIYDPEGFDFEISMSNLEYILNNCNVNNGELEGEFVYLWLGKTLLLIPTHTEYYKEALKLKSNEKEKISVKDLKIGSVYQDKKHDILYTYLGKYDYYKEFSKKEKETYALKIAENNIIEGCYPYYSEQMFELFPHVLKPKKQHIFFNQKTKKFEVNITSKLAFMISDEYDGYHDELYEFLNSKYGKITEEIFMNKISKDLIQEFSDEMILHFKDVEASYNQKFYDFNPFLKINENYYLKLKLSTFLTDFDSQKSVYTNRIFSLDLTFYYHDKKNNTLIDTQLSSNLKSAISHNCYNNNNISLDELEQKIDQIINQKDKLLDELQKEKGLITTNYFLDKECVLNMSKISKQIKENNIFIPLYFGKEFINYEIRKNRIEEYYYVNFLTKDLKSLLSAINKFDLYSVERILKKS